MFPDAVNFDIFLAVMAVTAVVVFIALHYVEAGYGVSYTRRWGPTVDNRLGWVLMEAPVFIAMALLWWHSDRRLNSIISSVLSFFRCLYAAAGVCLFPLSPWA